MIAARSLEWPTDLQHVLDNNIVMQIHLRIMLMRVSCVEVPSQVNHLGPADSQHVLDMGELPYIAAI